MSDPLQRPGEPSLREFSAFELKSAADFLPAILAEQKRPRLAVRADDGFDILDPDLPGSVYEIDDDILRDARQAFFWVRQLAEKTWVTKTTLLDLANAVLAHLDRGKT